MLERISGWLQGRTIVSLNWHCLNSNRYDDEMLKAYKNKDTIMNKKMLSVGMIALCAVQGVHADTVKVKSSETDYFARFYYYKKGGRFTKEKVKEVVGGVDKFGPLRIFGGTNMTRPPRKLFFDRELAYSKDENKLKSSITVEEYKKLPRVYVGGFKKEVSLDTRADKRPVSTGVKVGYIKVKNSSGEHLYGSIYFDTSRIKVLEVGEKVVRIPKGTEAWFKRRPYRGMLKGEETSERVFVFSTKKADLKRSRFFKEEAEKLGRISVDDEGTTKFTIKSKDVKK